MKNKEKRFVTWILAALLLLVNAPRAYSRQDGAQPNAQAVSQTGLLPVYGIDFRFDATWVDGAEFPSQSTAHPNFGVNAQFQHLDAYTRILLYQFEDQMNHAGLHRAMPLQIAQDRLLKAADALRQSELESLKETGLNATPLMVNASFDHELIKGGAIAGATLGDNSYSQAYGRLKLFLAGLATSPNIDVIDVNWFAGSLGAGNATVAAQPAQEGLEQIANAVSEASATATADTAVTSPDPGASATPDPNTSKGSETNTSGSSNPGDSSSSSSGSGFGSALKEKLQQGLLGLLDRVFEVIGAKPSGKIVSARPTPTPDTTPPTAPSRAISPPVKRR